MNFEREGKYMKKYVPIDRQHSRNEKKFIMLFNTGKLIYASETWTSSHDFQRKSSPVRSNSLWKFTSKKQQQTILISLLIDYRKINEKDMAQSQSKLHCTEQLGAIKCI